MRPAAAGLFLVLAAAAAGAQPDGVEINPAGGRFKIRFPAQPREKTQKASTPIGELTIYAATYATPEGNVLLVSQTDYPADAAKPADHPTLLAGAGEALVAKDGKKVSDTAVTFGPDKTAGREVVVDKGKVQLRFRMLIRDNRLYQIGAVGTGAFVTGKGTTEFLDSFELVK
ncbi:MAG TPA: hypothetical protein VH092_07385 [Urbifossiella sp.]|jgi:hypothetical protein|nr:hypothetical protein [Urbifossiella sp.]